MIFKLTIMARIGPKPTSKSLIESMSPFQSQLTILQNAINNWHTLHDNFSNPHAETLSQTGVSCSYISYMLSLQNMYPFRNIFTIIKKKAIFFIVS